MPISNASYFKWSYSNQISWRNKWNSLVAYELGKDKPATMPAQCWKHYVYGKTALLINDNLDPVEVMRTRCEKETGDGGYSSFEEWEQIHMTEFNREYWSKVVAEELKLIERYFGTDTEGLENWRKMYAKYLEYATSVDG